MDALSSQLSNIFGIGDTTDPLRDAGAISGGILEYIDPFQVSQLTYKCDKCTDRVTGYHGRRHILAVYSVVYLPS